MTWGNSAAGGDICCVQDQLHDVEDSGGEVGGVAGVKSYKFQIQIADETETDDIYQMLGLFQNQK